MCFYTEQNRRQLVIHRNGLNTSKHVFSGGRNHLIPSQDPSLDTGMFIFSYRCTRIQTINHKTHMTTLVSDVLTYGYKYKTL